MSDDCRMFCKNFEPVGTVEYTTTPSYELLLPVPTVKKHGEQGILIEYMNKSFATTWPLEDMAHLEEVLRWLVQM